MTRPRPERPADDRHPPHPEPPPPPQPPPPPPPPQQPPPPPPPPPLRPRVARWGYALLAYACLALALAGVALPGLPTVPFLLLAAWAASRGSTRLHRWLYEHPRFGRTLTDWEQQGAVSRRSKVLAVGLLAASWLIMVWRLSNPWLLLAMAVVFTGVGAFVTTRPAPRPR
jgi:uncharacterized protein